MSLRSPVNGTVVSVFLGQPPASDWCDRTLAAIFLPSSEANQLSGLFRYLVTGTAAGAIAGQPSTRPRATTVAADTGRLAGSLMLNLRFADASVRIRRLTAPGAAACSPL